MTLADKMGLGPKREWSRQGINYRVTVTPPAWSGFAKSSIWLTIDQFKRFQSWLHQGGLIQDHLRDLTADEREILISGIGPTEWADKVAEDEE